MLACNILLLLQLLVLALVLIFHITESAADWSFLCADSKGPRKVFLPNKLLECIPRLSGLPNELLRWNTNEVTS